MADVVGEGEIIIYANTQPYDAAMAKAPAAAKGAATQVSGAFSGEFNKVSAAAGAMASAVGGRFGQIGSLANSAIRPLTEVSGALGAIGATAAAVGFAAAAIKGIANNAVDAAGRLDKLGIAIGPEAAAQVQSYESATKDLGIAFDELSVVVGGPIAGDLADIASAVAGTVRAFRDGFEAAKPYADELEEISLFGRASAAILTLGISEIARATYEAAKANNVAEVSTEGLTEAEKKLLEQQQMERQAQLDMAAGAWAQAKADQAAAAAAKDRASAEAASAQESARVRAEMLAQIQAEQEAREGWTDTSFLHLSAIDSKYKAKAIQNEHDITLAAKKESKDRRKVADDEAQAKTLQTMATTAAYLQAGDQVLGSITAIGDAAVQRAEAQIASGEKLSRSEVKSANNAIAMSRDVSLVQAGISATLAGIGTYVSLVTELVPAPVAAGIAATVTTASYAAAAAGIASGTPEFFHYTGGGGGGNSGSAANNGGGAAVDPTTGQAHGKGDPDLSGADLDDPRMAPKGGKGSTSRTGGDRFLLVSDGGKALLVSGRPGQRGGARR